MKRSVPILVSGALLGMFGVVGAGLVGLSHDLTAERIAQNERQAVLDRLQVLLPVGTVANDLLHETLDVSAPDLLGTQTTRVHIGRDADGEPVAVVLNPVVTQGYSGDIKLMVAIRADGTISGVRVLSHRETPGLGDKIERERSPWIEDFDGKSLLQPDASGWKVRRDGGVFDQFTGATITPRAVVRGVHDSLLYFNANRPMLFDPDATVAEINE
jgi:Na+-translocating ferredoxin:NAD+ oxidoreductase subunit G